MEEKVLGIIKEIKDSNEETLRKTIEDWYEKIHTAGIHIGAYYISSAVHFAIKKNIDKPGKPSLNDYKRMVKDINKIIDVQLKTQQNDYNNKEEEQA